MTLSTILLAFSIILILSLITGILLTIYEKKKVKKLQEKKPIDDSPTIVMNLDNLAEKKETIESLQMNEEPVVAPVVQEVPMIEKVVEKEPVEIIPSTQPVVEVEKTTPIAEEKVEQLEVKKNKNLEFNSQLVLIPFAPDEGNQTSNSSMDLI